MLLKLYQTLFHHFGPQGWWPGETPLEVAVGAILTQNTNWQNVAQAIARLKAADLLSVPALWQVSPEALADQIRPAGYYLLKAQRLKNFINYLVDRYDGAMTRLALQPLELLRPELLAINGIGPETADSILLYALAKPIFVVDAYTHRIFSRHGLVAGPYAYDHLQGLCQARNSMPCWFAPAKSAAAPVPAARVVPWRGWGRWRNRAQLERLPPPHNVR